jgi:hypothetical protein
MTAMELRGEWAIYGSALGAFNRRKLLFVIPAKAGIQCLSAQKSPASSFRWNDEQGWQWLSVHQGANAVGAQ